ncbi:Protein BIG GRAIN 1-like A [Melia azedarach]|uniref:Protein BIG GRAIN 1-like A n=1 Tax=Melia azedarach TaxID=155640 RepID=A0ACC1XDX5_MELAZ|nr:Protein BIG GRAIN 1-like A [Melia azedarach]
MYRWEKTLREDRYVQERKNPSFSSSLLDEIYRSTDDGSTKSPDLKFYRETMQKKQSRNGVKSGKKVDEEQMSSLRRACLIDKWMEKKSSEKANVKGRQVLTEYDHDHDQDVLFFSSTSSSSDSSSLGFSSSDTDSFYGSRPRSSCFVPQRPKPVRTSISVQPEKTKKKERTLFHEQRELHMFDDYHYTSAAEHTPKLGESDLIKSKSRALKIYNNLKKVKQPISPGGRLANFINSLFTAGNAKKTKNSSSLNTSYDDLNSKSGQGSTCSSASSFSRSCLSKNSPSTRERLRNGVKRSVRFYPVSIIVDEDCRPCGQKSLYEEEEASLMSVSVPTAWKIGKSPSRKNEEELKVQVMERGERVGEIAREFLKTFHQNQKKSDAVSRDIRINYEDDDDEDDDAASYSSSDLFELDHLAVIGNNRYCEELPVYETTHVDTNRAIANGLLM